MTTTLEETYQRYFPIIREKCRRMLGDAQEAQDVAQETFVRLWRAELVERDPRQVTAWIYRTSTRLVIDRLRQRRWLTRLLGTDGEDEPSAEPAAPLDLESQVLDRQRLRQLVRQVPARELEVALLHRVDGLSQIEIAEVLDASERTVRRVLCRFDERLEKLRERQERIHDAA